MTPFIAMSDYKFNKCGIYEAEGIFRNVKLPIGEIHKVELTPQKNKKNEIKAFIHRPKALSKTYFTLNLKNRKWKQLQGKGYKVRFELLSSCENQCPAKFIKTIKALNPDQNPAIGFPKLLKEKKCI